MPNPHSFWSCHSPCAPSRPPARPALPWPQDYKQRLSTVWYICAANATLQMALLTAFITCISWDKALQKAARMSEKATELGGQEANGSKEDP